MRAAVAIFGVLALGVALIALWPHDSQRAPDPCGPVDTHPRKTGIEAASEATLCLVNRERTSRGLPALHENALLDEASLEHSRDMVQRDYFEHTAVDGRTLGDRLRAIGYSRGFSASAGENIAYGVGFRATPAHIVEAWMNSPGHRADILRPSFTEIGIGIALGAPEVATADRPDAATYTTDFGGVVDPSLPNG